MIHHDWTRQSVVASGCPGLQDAQIPGLLSKTADSMQNGVNIPRWRPSGIVLFRRPILVRSFTADELNARVEFLREHNNYVTVEKCPEIPKALGNFREQRRPGNRTAWQSVLSHRYLSYPIVSYLGAGSLAEVANRTLPSSLTATADQAYQGAQSFKVRRMELDC